MLRKKGISWYRLLTYVVAFISILSAVMITMIAVGIERPGTGKTAYTLWPAPVSFASAFLSVTNIVFAYGKDLWLSVEFAS